ncbi:MAG: DUF11 domain-containing protein, partial [Methylococcales bacterium]|nr:DUF11 domain-containing protein [Methylococcales bacterium]
ALIDQPTLGAPSTVSVLTQLFNTQDFLYTSAGIQTPSSTATAIPSCGGSPVDLLLNVADTFTIDTVRVGVNALVTDIDQTTLELISPNGTLIEVSNGKSTFNDTFMDILYADGAPAGGGNDNLNFPFYDDPEEPGDPFSDFNGEAAAGVWTLRVCGSPGTFNHWTLFFDENAQVDLALDKTASNQLVTTGDVISYTLVTVNSGGLDAVGTSISDTIPAGTTLVPGSLQTVGVPNAVDNAGIIQWDGTILANNNQITITYAVEVTAPNGTITNTATVTQSTLVNTITDQTLTQIVDGFEHIFTQETPFLYGDCRFGYQTSELIVPDSLIIQALGLGLNVPFGGSRIELMLEAPNGKYVPITTHSTSGGVDAIYAGGPSNSPQGSQSASFPFYEGREKPVGDLDTLIGSNAQGTWKLHMCDNAGNTFTFGHWSLLFDSGLNLQKTGDIVVVPNKLFTYTLTVQNPTGVVATGVTITDALPAEVAFVGSSLSSTSGVAAENAGIITWQGDLNPSQSATISFQVQVTAQTAGVFNNNAILDHNTLTTPITRTLATQIVEGSTSSTNSQPTELAFCTPTIIAHTNFEVTDDFIITDVRLGFNYMAGNRDQTSAFLRSPSGTQILLFNDDDQSTIDNNFDMLIEDDGFDTIHDG